MLKYSQLPFTLPPALYAEGWSARGIYAKEETVTFLLQRSNDALVSDHTLTFPWKSIAPAPALWSANTPSQQDARSLEAWGRVAGALLRQQYNSGPVPIGDKFNIAWSKELVRAESPQPYWTVVGAHKSGKFSILAANQGIDEPTLFPKGMVQMVFKASSSRKAFELGVAYRSVAMDTSNVSPL